MKKTLSKPGSALLITMLLMGLLMTITLGISNLVIREISVTTSIVSANQAFYAAEAGVEKALKLLAQNGPGYEKLKTTEELKISADKSLKTEFEIFNKSDRIPDFADNTSIFVQPYSVDDSSTDCVLSNAKNQLAIAKDKTQLYTDCPKATYTRLKLNDTHIIPLYSVNENGEPVDVEDFMVQYYLAAKDQSDLGVKGFDLQQFDVLRWKLYGKPKFSDENKTESIADIYPGINNNDERNPVCIGTDGSLKAVVSGDGAESCLFPTLNATPPKKGDTEDSLEVGLWSAARECYLSDAGAFVTNNQQIKGTQLGTDDPDNFYGVCLMKDFIDSHKQNYLVLTNLVNPTILGLGNVTNEENLARADIYYRVLTRGNQDDLNSPQFARESADIVASGFNQSGNVIKTLQVKYKKPSFLPVFNFSLYVTKGNE